MVYIGIAVFPNFRKGTAEAVFGANKTKHLMTLRV